MAGRGDGFRMVHKAISWNMQSSTQTPPEELEQPDRVSIPEVVDGKKLTLMERQEMQLKEQVEVLNGPRCDFRHYRALKEIPAMQMNAFYQWLLQGIDVLALQEVNIMDHDMLKALCARLNQQGKNEYMVFGDRVIHPRNTRYPIGTALVISDDLQPVDFTAALHEISKEAQERHATLCKIILGDEENIEAFVASVHLAIPIAAKHEERMQYNIRLLEAIVKVADGKPCMILGDFNSYGEDIERLANQIDGKLIRHGPGKLTTYCRTKPGIGRRDGIFAEALDHTIVVNWNLGYVGVSGAMTKEEIGGIMPNLDKHPSDHLPITTQFNV